MKNGIEKWLPQSMPFTHNSPVLDVSIITKYQFSPVLHLNKSIIDEKNVWKFDYSLIISPCLISENKVTAIIL